MSARRRVTTDIKKKFLKIVAENGGIVTDACSQLNVSRTAMYSIRNEDPIFEEAWDKAVDVGVDVIEDECKRRALEGTDEIIFYQGIEVATVKKKSDYCLGLVLKAHRVRYRRTEISGPGGKPIGSGNVMIYLPNNNRDNEK
jgi:hypothetical protein